jgi:hypothetical protein
MHKLINYTLLLIVTISISCKKNDHETLLINSFGKGFINFKPGTYWIYNNDSTNIEDSIYVTDYFEEFFDHISGDGQRWQYLNLIFTSSLQDTGGITIDPVHLYYEIFNIFISPRYNESTLLGYNDLSYMTGISDRQINGNSFTHVYDFIQKYPQNDSSSINRSRSLISRDYGILQCQIFYNDCTSTTKSLVRYSIVR